MIDIIISVIPIIFICFYFYYVRKIGGQSHFNEFLSLKKRGQICYDCSQGFDILVLPDHVEPILCKTCDRDRVVNRILKPWTKILYFDKFLFTNNFSKVQSIIAYCGLFSVILQIILLAFKIQTHSLISTFLISTYWFLMILRVKITVKNKTL
jgi:hypothetical protein